MPSATFRRHLLTDRLIIPGMMSSFSGLSRESLPTSFRSHPHVILGLTRNLKLPPIHILSISVKISTFDGKQEYDSTMRTELDIIAEKAYAREEGLEEGRAEGRAEERERVAKKLLEEGLDHGIICRSTGLTPEQLDSL